MKTKTILCLLICIAIQSFAQQGINYKALIKDNGGNIVANQNITLQFSIFEGAALTNMVYQETHAPTTDGNGIIIISIGEGTIVDGAFTTINWGDDDHYLNTQINTGSGFVDMGTTAFKNVPLAFKAETANYATTAGIAEIAETANNLTGFEAIDEGNGIGWRLIGRDPDYYGNIGLDAVDLSFGNSLSSTRGATGERSIAMGDRTTASGYASAAIGIGGDATGELSIATGSNTTASGYNSTAMGSFTTASGHVSIAMGNNTTASGDLSIATGSNTIASGSTSIAMGVLTNASGVTSTALGSNSTASGNRSIAMGDNTNASGYASTALGWATTASGNASTTMGFNTNAATYASIAIGRYNTGFGDFPSEWDETDPLFEIGNGTSSTNRSNALTVLKNGKVGIGVTPLTPLQIDGGTDANITNGASGYLMIGSIFETNVVFDDNEIMARNTVNPSTLFLQHNGGAVSVGGSVVHSSDRRLKRDIEPIAYGLQTVLKLEPKSYYWKNRPKQKQCSLGLIAQEVQPIIKELVLNNEKDDMLSVNYTELIPILIKAIQEQQEIIGNQNSEIEGLTSEITALKSMNTRIKALEQQLKTIEK